MPMVLSAQEIRKEQNYDDELPEILKKSSLNLQNLAVKGKTKVYCDISTGIVRPYIPKSLRRTAFDIIHGLSHPSGRSTTRLLKEKYIWPGIKNAAIKWSRECLDCQKAKIQRHNRVIAQGIKVPDSRFNHIHIDLIILPPVDGYGYCLTIIDRFSRWPVAVPLKDSTTETVATALFDHWISQYGSPLTITSDQGPQFESELFASLTKFLGCKRICTSPYHPASNGIVERWHRTLKAALMCNPNIPWTSLLPSVMLGLRTCYKEDLKPSPAEMLYGTTLKIPGEFFVHQDLEADPHRKIADLHRKI